MFHGMCLFVLGLLTGFAEQHFTNVRMGLAAHLEGLMNGTFLIALGAIWPHVRLSPTATTVAYWTVLYGTYVNWLITILAAIFGTAALSPITGVGHSGLAWQESFVTATPTSGTTPTSTPNMLREITHFFSTYKDLEGKRVEIKGWHDDAYARDRVTRPARQFLEHKAKQQPQPVP